MPRGGDRLEPAQGAARVTEAIRFDDRVALVTGAGRGLGRAYALELARRGAALVVNDPGVNPRGDDAGDPAAADAVVAEIVGAGGRAVADHGSVADPAAAAAMVRRAVDTFGALDVVINNAGNNRRNTFAETTLEDFRNVLDVHLTGTLPGDAGGVADSRGAALRPDRLHHEPGRLLRQGGQRRLRRRQDGRDRPDARRAPFGRAARHQGELHLALRAHAPRRRLPEGHRRPDRPRAGRRRRRAARERGLSGVGRGRDRRRRAFRASRGRWKAAASISTNPAEVSAEALGRRIDEICDMRDPLHYPDALAAVGTTFARVKRIAGL